MGKDYIPLRVNGATQEQIDDVYKRLKTKSVVSATYEEWFFKKNLPKSSFISDIEVGNPITTRESIVRFNDGTFIAFDGVVKIETILRSGR